LSNRLVPGFTPPRVPYRKAFDPSCGCEKRILKPPAGFHAMTTGRMRGDILRRPNYNHVHGEQRIAGLNPKKYTQRKDLAAGMTDDGIILHLYAGNGNLARAIYKNRARGHILVDRAVNPRLKNELRNAVVHEKSMDKFLNEDLPQITDRITLVDIDPFGSPAPAIKTFFANYKVRNPLRVAVTDGYANFLALNKDSERGQRNVRNLYLSTHAGDGSSKNQLRLLDNLMNQMALRYNLRIRRVNEAQKYLPTGSKTIYAGYQVTPT